MSELQDTASRAAMNAGVSIADLLRAETRRRPVMPDGPMVLSDEGVGALFGRSRSWVWRMVKEGNLPPPVKFGGSTYWHKSEIVAIINGLRPAA